MQLLCSKCNVTSCCNVTPCELVDRLLRTNGFQTLPCTELRVNMYLSTHPHLPSYKVFVMRLFKTCYTSQAQIADILYKLTCLSYFQIVCGLKYVIVESKCRKGWRNVGLPLLCLEHDSHSGNHISQQLHLPECTSKIVCVY